VAQHADLEEKMMIVVVVVVAVVVVVVVDIVSIEDAHIHSSLLDHMYVIRCHIVYFTARCSHFPKNMFTHLNASISATNDSVNRLIFIVGDRVVMVVVVG
jgi:hypothetical protein